MTMARRLHVLDRPMGTPITDDTILVPKPMKSFASHKKPSMCGASILEQQHFLRMLRLERKRTERSGKPFLLALVSGRTLFQSPKSVTVLSGIAAAVATSTRETDSLGWYEHGKTLGLLFTEIGSPEVTAELIIGKVSSAIKDSLGVAQFDVLRITFHIFPNEFDSQIEDADVDLVFYPDNSQRHDPRKGARVFKRLIDVAGSLLALSFFLPLLLVIAALVRLSSEGPILFRQRRIGQFGVPFTFYKFRSMYSNNDSKIHEEYVARLIQGKVGPKQSCENDSKVYKLTNDPRITPLGRLLRRTSLDELPQLFNVLSGKMSLVGPRPPLPYEYEKYDTWHRRRVFEVKPGITGLWQIVGRSRTTFDEMVRLDLKYARMWSVWLDLKILLRTPRAVVSADGAY